MQMEKICESIESKVPTDDNTYVGEDGLLYCSKCHTARQVRVSALGKDKTVFCVCKCMRERDDQEEAQRKQREYMDEVMKNQGLGFSDKALRKWTFAADDGRSEKLTNAMQAYVDNFPELRKKGKGLLLYGDVGRGKSFRAACIVNALIERGYPCLMTNFSRLTNELIERRDGKQSYIDSLCRYALIAIDDLGVERDTAYMNENITVIIDSLYRANVPMIITSNYTPKELTEENEIRRKRVFDRMLERCHPIIVEGESRRKEKGREDFASMNKLLGLER